MRTCPQPARSGPQRSATDLAHETLTRQVLLCELYPGTELREAEIAARLGVSRTPVREALNRLVHDGFVEVRPRQGYRVTEVTLAAVHEVFELAAVLEPTIVALACERATPRALESFRELALTATPADFHDAVAHEHNVHVTLAGLSGNQRLARTMRQVQAELQRILVLALGEVASYAGPKSDHSDLFAALTDRDPERARQLVSAETDEQRHQVMDALFRGMSAVPLSVGQGASADPGVEPTRGARSRSSSRGARGAFGMS